MVAEPDVTRLARTMGDPTRIRMLALLMQGRALTAKELAYGAEVSPPTATAHLRRLLGDDLIHARAQGRHKYFKLASPDVARCIEAFMTIALPVRVPPTTTPPPLCEARMCYDHLAGKLGTHIARILLVRKLLTLKQGNYVPTKSGIRWLGDFGIDYAGLAASTRRKVGPACLDWSERTDHLGGALGAAIAQRLFTLRWLKQKPDSRAVTVTSTGRAELARWFSYSPDRNG